MPTRPGPLVTTSRRWSSRRRDAGGASSRCRGRDDDGLLRVAACGLCGTDHEQYTGALPAGFAFVPGHESVGVVEAVGARAAERWGVAVGDCVAVEVFQSCGALRRVPAGGYRRCAHHGMGDMYGFIACRAAARAVGWLRRAPVPRTRLDAPARPRRARPGRSPRCSTRSAPASAGPSRCRRRSRATSSPCSAPGCAACRRAPPPRRRAPAFVLVTGVGPRDAERLALAPVVRRRPRRRRGDDRPGGGAARRDRRAGRRRRRRHRQGARRASPRRSRWLAPAARSCVAGTRGVAGHARVLARPRRLQGAAHPRRARGRRRRLPGGARPARRRPLPVRRPSPALRRPRRRRGPRAPPWPARPTNRARARRDQAVSRSSVTNSGTRTCSSYTRRRELATSRGWWNPNRDPPNLPHHGRPPNPPSGERGHD